MPENLPEEAQATRQEPAPADVPVNVPDRLTKLAATGIAIVASAIGLTMVITHPWPENIFGLAMFFVGAAFVMHQSEDPRISPEIRRGASLFSKYGMVVLALCWIVWQRIPHTH